MIDDRLPPHLEDLGRQLTAAADQLSTAMQKQPSRAWRRPRVLAGGSLGLAGVAAAATLAFTGGAAAPAYAITRQGDGTVLVTVSANINANGLAGADRQLIRDGIDEEVNLSTAPGPAASSDPVACESVANAGSDYPTANGYEPAKPQGPAVQVRIGSDNTQVIPAGETGAGTVHLASCVYWPTSALGNSGTKFLDANEGR